MNPLLSISVLGPLQVTLAGVPVSTFKYSKARALLAYLALKPGQVANRLEVCALLWPDLPEPAARRNLSLVLMALRQALTEPASGRRWLAVDRETIGFNPELPVAVDAVRFNALLDEAERHPHRSWRTCPRCAERLTEALALYRDEFLAQFFVPDSAPFEEWALAWRERLRQRAFSLLERLAARAEWCGDFAQAAGCARQSMALDNLREASQRELMRLLALAGEWAAAEAQYQHLRRMLASEFGLSPEAETEQVNAHIRDRRPGGLRQHTAPPFNGPNPPNVLMGREAELALICERLHDPAVQALTLTGPPGLGKTRLALEAARRLRYDFEDGVHVVELAPAAEAGQVPSAIAQVLGVKVQPGQNWSQALTNRLKTQHALLVLDNFEHLLDAAGFVADLLAACPGLKVLATSRVPLRIRAEQQHALPPLAAEAAVALFAARAQAARAGFELTAENAGVVAALCERVDHLPLAIELIAVRARALTPVELLGQLAQPLEALAQGTRDMPDRHRTLRNAIAWSYTRLSPDEQRVFRHLGLWVGGGTVNAVQAVAGEGPPVLAALEGLSEASLAQAQAVGGETRFTTLETLRAYALEQLAIQDELAEGQARHAAYCLRLAEQAQPQLEGPDQLAWLDRLEHEHPNLRAALTWSLSHNPELGLRLALALWPFWMIRGYASEARGWLQRLRARTEAQPAPSVLEADVLVVESRLAIDQGDYREAVDLALKSRALSLRLENTLGIAWALQALGHAKIELGEYDAARAHLAESQALFEGEADRPGMASALNSLGFVATRQGDYAAAQAFTEQALALNRELNRPRLVATISVNLGMTALAQGDYATAQRLTEAGLDSLRRLRDTNAVPIALLNLGNIYQDTGDLGRARACFEEAIALGRSLGNTSVSAPLSALGFVLLRLGELPAARACMAEALQARVRAGEQRGVAIALDNFAHLAQAEQEPGRAARLLGAAEALRTAIGAPIQPRAVKDHAHLVDAVRVALDEASFASAWMEGQALTLEQAAALALRANEAG